MCLICIEYEKGKLKINEALRNLEEMRESIGEIHYDETRELLIEDMMNEFNFDDEYWEKLGFGD